jgi:hypothetical protein
VREWVSEWDRSRSEATKKKNGSPLSRHDMRHNMCMCNGSDSTPVMKPNRNYPPEITSPYKYLYTVLSYTLCTTENTYQ